MRNGVRSLLLQIPNSSNPARILSIARRQVEARCKTEVLAKGQAAQTLHLGTQRGIETDAFRIEDGPCQTIRIVGGDERALLYGLGKFLRSSEYQNDVLIPSSWRGVSAPDRPVRGIYFATHFHNFYHVAPLDELEHYIEDLALWGVNTLAVWFDMNHYPGIRDPDAQAMLTRLRFLLHTAKQLGLSTALMFIGNEIYARGPGGIRSDHGGAEALLIGGSGGCPNKPGARESIARAAREKLEHFADLAPDFLLLWPYDPGGCNCPQCRPWGANGFLTVAEPTARMYRQLVPNGKVILSTWYFDRFTQGEWAGLDRAFREKPDWVDYLMADDCTDQFPPYPLEHGVPGGLPMLSFPEISMYQSLWGGIGANPLPRHLQSLWDMAGDLLVGGFPYSEGIFEDLNKVIVAQLQWKKDRPAMDIVREYIAFEYSSDVVEEVSEAVEILERNIAHGPFREENGVYSIPMSRCGDADRAWSLLQNADRRMSAGARGRWRWRILHLRGLIDAELAAHGFRITERCEEAFQELVRIYHAERAAFVVSPPTKEALSKQRPPY